MAGRRAARFPTRLERLRAKSPGIGFKLDWDPGWTDALVERLAADGDIAVVDLKGLYRGDFRGPEADPEGYARVARGLPGIWLEDPEWNEITDAVLDESSDRVTWDACLHDWNDVRSRPRTPRAINIKPSRIGTLRALLEMYDRAEAAGMVLYGGGQYELGPGREQARALASWFHPDAPNDVAPVAFHRADDADRLAASPLPPARGAGLAPRQSADGSVAPAAATRETPKS